MFDPYHKWLGISPKDQPPTFYRLLGIDLFESDFDTIENAVSQKMSHIRTFQQGKYAAESQKILNELAQAKVVLFDKDKKHAYDASLRAKSIPVQPRFKPQPRQLHSTPSVSNPKPRVVVEDSVSSAASQGNHFYQKWLPALLSSFITLLAVILLFVFNSNNGSDNRGVHRIVQLEPTVVTPEPVVETQPEPEPVVETQPEPEPVVETQPEPEPVVETQPEPEPVVETQPEPEPVVETQPEPEPVVETQPEPEPVVETQPEPEPEPQPEPEPVVETQPEPEPVVETQPEPEPEPQPEPEPKPTKLEGWESLGSLNFAPDVPFGHPEIPNDVIVKFNDKFSGVFYGEGGKIDRTKIGGKEVTYFGHAVAWRVNPKFLNVTIKFETEVPKNQNTRYVIVGIRVYDRDGNQKLAYSFHPAKEDKFDIKVVNGMIVFQDKKVSLNEVPDPRVFIGVLMGRSGEKAKIKFRLSELED